MRVIDADALKLSLMTISSDELVRYCYPCEKVLKKIDEQPTIEPERKTGTCDECKYEYYFDYQLPCKKCIRIASMGRDGDYFEPWEGEDNG